MKGITFSQKFPTTALSVGESRIKMAAMKCHSREDLRYLHISELNFTRKNGGRNHIKIKLLFRQN